MRGPFSKSVKGKDMEPLFEDLVTLLQKEVGLYGRLLDLMTQERSAVLSKDMDLLRDNTEDKTSLLLKIRDVEGERQTMVQDLAESLGRSATGLRLRDLSRAAQEPYASQLEACRTHLSGLAKSISEAGARNVKLINHSLDLVRNSFSFLRQLTSPDTVYQHTGRMLPSDCGGRVLSGEF